MKGADPLFAVTWFARRKWLQGLGGAVFALGSSRAAVFASPDTRENLVDESRAILDEGLNWVTRDAAERVCSRIAAAGFNVFVPCVWHGRGTVWPSRLAPWDHHNVRITGFDPLDNLLRTAAPYGIEVHPWFTLSLRQRDFFGEFVEEGTPSERFDIHMEAFRELMCALIDEVVSAYPIHGVNLDYVSAGGICTGERCARDYRARTGRNLAIDSQIRRVPGTDVAELIEWQAAAVTDLVARISERCRSKRANLVISVSGDPDHRLLALEGHASARWADDALIDVLYNMHYEPAPDFAAIEASQRTMKRPEAIVVGCGNYEEATLYGSVRPREAGKVAELIRRARGIQRGNGVCVYLYSMLTGEQIAVLRSSVFADTARPRWQRAVSGG